MGFHRLVVPVYAGGLRGGDDYVNNAVAGTPAPADGALGAGTYIGSYFFAENDQVTGAAINRGLKALAENCDFLDDAIVQMALDYTAADAVVAADFAAADVAVAATAAAATATAQAAADAAAIVAANAVRPYTTFRAITGDDSITLADGSLFLDGFVGITDIALPDPATAIGHWFLLIDRGGLIETTNPVNLTPFGAELINGAGGSWGGFTNRCRAILFTDGVDWFTLGLVIP